MQKGALRKISSAKRPRMFIYAFGARLKPVVGQPSSKLERTTVAINQHRSNLDFHYLGNFNQKRKSLEKYLTQEKCFDFQIFGLKYVSNHSESIPTKKKFSTKIFYLCHFFTILAILAEKRLSPTKKKLHGKNFDFEIFVLKNVSNHSDSIPTKKIFDQNFCLCHFFSILPI